MTNYDRIKNMSVKEMSKFLNACGHDFPPFCDTYKGVKGLCDYNCFRCTEIWLESEVTEE